jgi:enoyl-CoA hydratase/carnithine racemase
METDKDVLLSTIDEEGVLILTLNRANKHNALNTELTQKLLDAIRGSEHDERVRALVLVGAQPSFCAGADTTEFNALTPQDPKAVLARADLTTALHLSFSQLSKPVVAAVTGNALGGGAGLALACDMVVMAEKARLGYPELKHGIVAAVVLANLVRQLGPKNAFELVALGEPIGGLEAEKLGLVNRVTALEDTLPEAIKIAKQLASWSPIAMATTKRTFYRAMDLSLASALDVGRDANVMMRGFKRVDPLKSNPSEH